MTWRCRGNTVVRPAPPLNRWIVMPSAQEELVRNWGLDKRWVPAMAAEDRRRRYAEWGKAVGRSLDWV